MDRKSKGERTAEKILDAAENLFAERGYEGTTLREIARRVGIQEPGIYNHFKGKEALYAAVLDRALSPMLDAMRTSMASTQVPEAYTGLAGVITDRLAEHPQIAVLFHQVLQSRSESAGGKLMEGWLDRLFGEGMSTLDAIDSPDLDRHDRAIAIIAMFNLTTGYFLSQRVLSSLVEHNGGLADPDNIARQKKLLNRLMGSMIRK